MNAVYKAIAAVQSDLSKTGIAKNRQNNQKNGGGYMFRGIDDVYSALAPLLATHGLCVIPRMLERVVVEREARSGGALFYTTVKAEFDFVAVEDGSKHTACTYGEAMDSGDKSTNKAMSAAYKYAAFLTFAIPTEGDNDADATTHEVAANTKVSQEQFEKLQHEADATGSNLQVFCQLFEINSLKEMPAARFNEAMNAFALKRKKMENGSGAVQ